MGNIASNVLAKRKWGQSFWRRRAGLGQQASGREADKDSAGNSTLTGFQDFQPRVAILADSIQAQFDYFGPTE